MTFKGVIPTNVIRRLLKSVVPYCKVNLCTHCTVATVQYILSIVNK